MKLLKKKYVILLISILLVLTFFYSYSYMRYYFSRSSEIHKSKLVLVESSDEKKFQATIFDTKRIFSSKKTEYFNQFFNDQLLVIEVPIKNYSFNSLIIKPIGSDEIQAYSDFYFNTLMFDSNLIAVKGYRNENENTKNIKKLNICINNNGEIVKNPTGNSSDYKDILQFVEISKMPYRNVRILNYYAFLAIEKNAMYYISGTRNSLICWADVKEFMKLKKIASVFLLDGGTSLEYCFKGVKNTYQFNSIPLRQFWFPLNSSYFIEGIER